MGEYKNKKQKENNLSDLKKAEKEWQEKKYQKTVDRFGLRKDNFESEAGKEPKALYTPLDLENIDYQQDLSFPGEFPYTRGVYSTMYRSRFWTMRQYSGFGTAEETNQRFKYLLNQGQTGLSVAFDLPTQIAYDSDHLLAEGEVGRVGVAIDSVEDMQRLFADIPLDEVSTSMTINSPAAVILAMYIVTAEEQGVDQKKLTGTIQNDILKEYIARGTYVYPPEASLRLITDIFEYCSQEMPGFNTISISGYHIREAGANAVQELAFTLADAIEYVKAALKIGLDIDDFAPRLSFFFASQMNIMEETAKFRAARKLWAEIIEERFDARKEKSKLLRFHTQTAGTALTAEQPLNNIIRVTIQALAAVMGGTQSLHTNSYDEALSLPSEEAVEIALRTQQIIAEESGIADVIDPLGGSYYLEDLTASFVEKTKKYLDKIDQLGGMVEAIKTGYVQQEIQDSAYQKQKEIDEGEKIVVGINKYRRNNQSAEMDLLKVDSSLEKAQKKRLNNLKKERNQHFVQKTLEKVKSAAETGDNLMPPIIEAVRAKATLNEISDQLRDVFGEYQNRNI
ncbi:Methylmalonyl-CoA mutase [Halanaerobium saccharolyticum subsp. saccharolyticum DSM 6643]|uniref:methylmalonyl-CoA mutase n=1 Tax=Halanaerobium saccharolyticum subsp. saccharolyticum DSM 6643 TaxID=1293054 RepID=M5E2I6_9FIRM|nr:methylmalonyl-CoA mutase family protein [Halanaerobium saccharolyticum]CCU80229.1 Methylmalonyl-CoA mutase [Halanaerobium saccharolyticum subsp. saccharolyticum DSM 6643]